MRKTNGGVLTIWKRRVASSVVRRIGGLPGLPWGKAARSAAQMRAPRERAFDPRYRVPLEERLEAEPEMWRRSM